jgi:hypothetical protein
MRIRLRRPRAVWVLALAANPLASQTPTRTADTLGVIALRAGRLIDGRGGAPVSNAVILVRGDRIQAVGVNLAIPGRARTRSGVQAGEEVGVKIADR